VQLKTVDEGEQPEINEKSDTYNEKRKYERRRRDASEPSFQSKNLASSAPCDSDYHAPIAPTMLQDGHGRRKRQRKMAPKAELRQLCVLSSCQGPPYFAIKQKKCDLIVAR